MSLKKLPMFKYQEVALDLQNNKEQLEVYNLSQSCVILAGPGSGKTKVLTLKLSRILNEDVSEPRGVACITYSKECVRELEKRLKDLGIKNQERLFVGTVHGFCLQNIIKNFIHLIDIDFPKDFKIATKKEQDSYWRKAFDLSIGIDEPYKRSWLTEVLKYRRTYFKNDEEYNTKDPRLAKWISDYETFLRSNNLIDYDDIMLVSLDIIRDYQWVRNIIAAKFPYLIIDEYQDLGLPLHKIISNLYTKTNIKLFAFGDPDQSIYGFTGANPGLIKELKDYEGIKVINLKFNYRSNTQIVEASNKILEEERSYQAVNNTDGIIKCYKYPNGTEQQAEGIFKEIIPQILERNTTATLGDIAILYLDKNEGDILESRIRELNWEFIRIDNNAAYTKTLFNRWLEDCAKWSVTWEDESDITLKDLLDRWGNFFKESKIELNQLFELKRNLVKFLWKFKAKDFLLREWLRDFFESVLKDTLENSIVLRDDVEEYQKLFEASVNGRLKNFKLSSLAGQSGSIDHINLITLHSAKGLEYEYIILFGMDEGKIPRMNADNPNIQEANRLFYVGLTRAKKEAHITFSGWFNYYDRRIESGPSRFVTKLVESLGLDVIEKEDFSKMTIATYIGKYSNSSWNDFHKVLINNNIDNHEFFDFLNPVIDYFNDGKKLEEYLVFIKDNIAEFITIFKENLEKCLSKTRWPFNQKFKFGQFIVGIYRKTEYSNIKEECIKILWDLAANYDIWNTQDIVLNELKILDTDNELIEGLIEYISGTNYTFKKLETYDLDLIRSEKIRAVLEDLVNK